MSEVSGWVAVLIGVGSAVGTRILDKLVMPLISDKLIRDNIVCTMHRDVDTGVLTVRVSNRGKYEAWVDQMNFYFHRELLCSSTMKHFLIPPAETKEVQIGYNQRVQELVVPHLDANIANIQVVCVTSRGSKSPRGQCVT